MLTSFFYAKITPTLWRKARHEMVTLLLCHNGSRVNQSARVRVVHEIYLLLCHHDNGSAAIHVVIKFLQVQVICELVHASTVSTLYFLLPPFNFDPADGMQENIEFRHSKCYWKCFRLIYFDEYLLVVLTWFMEYTKASALYTVIYLWVQFVITEVRRKICWSQF